MSLVYRLWGPVDRPIGERSEDRPAAVGEAVHSSALRRLEASETRSYRDGVAGRTLLPALEEGRIRAAAPSPAESDPGSVAWEAPPARSALAGIR